MRTSVLCVDDEPNTLSAYRRFLEEEYAVETASGGKAALTMMALHGPFAVVISDLQMPGMDGAQFLKTVREQYPDTVRVLLTGQTDLSHAIQAVNNGHIFQFLTKPCLPKTLRTTVAAAVAQYDLTLSDRRRAQAALRASEELSRAVLDSVLSQIAVLDREGTIVAINTAWSRFAMRSDSDSPPRNDRPNVGVNYLEACLASKGIFHETAATLVAGIRAVLDGHHESFGVEYEYNSPDQQQWFLMSVTPLNAVDGGSVVSHTDITERKLSEERLRASEERYRRLFDANPHPMWVIADATSHFVAVNDAAVRHYGYTRDRFLALQLLDIDISPTKRTESTPADVAARSRQHKLASGEVREVEIASHPIEFGGCAAHLVLAIDVTERKLLEEQLKQAQKLESIGQLAAGIAHEIKTPMQYIGDNTNFLSGAFQDAGSVLSLYRAAGGNTALVEAAVKAAESRDLDYLLEEVPNAIRQTLDGIQHVTRIVQAMKEFAHPGTEEKVPVALNHAIETVIAVARNEWKYAAEVVTELDPDLPLIPGLPGELNQVFLNLLVNAAHAIPIDGTGGKKGTITISTRGAKNLVEVRVRDSGCGIPEAIRDRIFDPFFTTKPVGQGSGQGLAIAHAVIVKRHGGAITFESEVGQGTTFIVRLPVDGNRLNHTDCIPLSLARSGLSPLIPGEVSGSAACAVPG